MLELLTIIFWIFFVIAGYISIKYYQSRNKKFFFKEGLYKAFLWSVLVFIFFGVLLAIILPSEPVDLSFFQLHSDSITGRASDENPLIRYLFMGLSVFSEMNIIGLISAALILMIWTYYIRGLDFFKKEKVQTTVIALLVGMLVTFFTFPLSDFIHSVLDIEYSDSTFYNLFIYSFIGIGMVEELIKLVPVLIILFFTDEIDEPIDLIYYASISALGFAFIENLLYFRDISGSIVIGRALTSAVGHMIDSSIVVYGILLYKFNKQKKSFRIIIIYFLLGAFAHALYDYFLFEDLILFFIAAFAFFIQVWAIMINNAINNSKYFDYSIIYKHNEVKFRLAMLLSGLIIMSFVINGFLVGKMSALYSYFASLAWGGLLIIFYVSSISSFDLFKGYWRPIKFSFSRPNDQAMPGMRGYTTMTSMFTENTIVPLNHIGKKIKLHSPAYNTHLCEIFHIGEGYIKDRILLYYENGRSDIDWFLVKLEVPLNVNDDYEKDLILIKIRNKYSSLVHDEHVECLLKLIPKGIDLQVVKTASSYISYGFIVINGEDYEYEV